MPDDDTLPAETPVATDAPATPVVDAGSASDTPVPTTAEGAAPAGDAPAAEATPEPPKYFEAMVEGKPFQIPLNAQFPWKRGDETGFHSLEEIQKSPMFERDYRVKTQQLAEQRRQYEQRSAEVERREIELQARVEAATNARRRLIEAQAKGGAEYERELRHQELMETDADYRERFEQSEEFRINQRLTQHDAERDRAVRTERTTERVRDYIREACAKAPGVDPAKIERLYGAALRSGHADLTADAVDALIAEEVHGINAITKPIKSEVEALQKQIAALQTQLQATEHNGRTAAAIDRAKGTQPGRPANGAPPAPRGAMKPFDPTKDDPDEYVKRWVREGAGAAS